MERSASAAARRTRGLLAFGALVVVSLVAGWAIFLGEKKPLAILGLVVLHVFLRRWYFRDFYLLTIGCAALSHVHFAVVKDEFERDKWLALFAMAGIALLTALLKWRSRPWPSWIHLPVGLLLGLVVWSVTWSPRQWISFQKAGVFGLAVVVAFVGAWAYASSVGHARRILDAHVDLLWIVFPLSVAVWALPVPGKTLGVGRFRAIFDNANALGVWASMSLPLVFALMLTHPIAWRRKVCALMLGTGLFVTLLCGSRGGVGGALIGIALYCFLRWPRRNVALGIAGALVIFFLFAYEVDLGFLGQKLEHLIRPKTLTTLSDRTIAWEAALFVGSHAPWLGHGFGLELELFHDYGFDIFVGSSATSVHSTYLAVYMTLGRVGVALLVLCLSLATLLGLDAWRRDRHGQLGLTALAVTCVVVAGAAHGVVENIFFSLGNPWSLPYWVSLALVGRLWTLQRRAAAERVRERLRQPRPGLRPVAAPRPA